MESNLFRLYKILDVRGRRPHFVTVLLYHYTTDKYLYNDQWIVSPCNKLENRLSHLPKCV